MGILIMIIVGGVAGWLAGQIMKGGGYGLVTNVVLGILGGIVGGWLFKFLGISIMGGIVGSIFTSALGAIVILAIAGLVKK